MNEQNIINELVPALKNYLDVSDKDREATKEIIRELKTVIKETRECVVSMKVRLERLDAHSESFGKSYEERKIDCSKKHELFAVKLSDIPAKGKLDKMEIAIDGLSKEVSGLVIKVYVVICSCCGIAAFIKWVLPLAISFMKKTGV